MELHAPSMWVFIVSFIIVLIAVISVFTPIPYISTYGFFGLPSSRTSCLRLAIWSKHRATPNARCNGGTWAVTQCAR